MSFNALILDDESQSRKALLQKLNLFCPEVTPIFEASGVREAWDILVSKKPDILFIDIHLSGELGFDLLDRIDNKKFALIFLTAFDEYAVQAFKFSAIDYLLYYHLKY